MDGSRRASLRPSRFTPRTAASPTRCSIQIAPGKEAERQSLPDPSTWKNRSRLADRGYPSVDYFEAVREQGGAFILRTSRAHDPWGRAAWVDGRRIALSKPVRLSRFIAQNVDRRMDLDVEYERDKGMRMVGFRAIVLPGKEKTMTRLCTNLPRRSQAPRRDVPRHIIDEIVMTRLACASIASAFRDGMAFLLANARRSDPRRDRKKGRLRARLGRRRRTNLT